MNPFESSTESKTESKILSNLNKVIVAAETEVTNTEVRRAKEVKSIAFQYAPKSVNLLRQVSKKIRAVNAQNSGLYAFSEPVNSNGLRTQYFQIIDFLCNHKRFGDVILFSEVQENCNVSFLTLSGLMKIWSYSAIAFTERVKTRSSKDLAFTITKNMMDYYIWGCLYESLYVSAKKNNYTKEEILSIGTKLFENKFEKTDPNDVDMATVDSIIYTFSNADVIDESVIDAKAQKEEFKTLLKDLKLKLNEFVKELKADMKERRENFRQSPIYQMAYLGMKANPKYAKYFKDPDIDDEMTKYYKTADQRNMKN